MPQIYIHATETIIKVPGLLKKRQAREGKTSGKKSLTTGSFS